MGIKNSEMIEIKIEKTTWNTSPCFSNLTDVFIRGCVGLKDLTWLLFAPNLIRLKLFGLKQLEDIINKEKAVSYIEKKTCNILPFQKLEYMTFHTLPELKSIYWNALPFLHLRYLYLRKCPKLRKLPLDSKSVYKVEEFVIDERKEWLERIE